MLIYNDLIILNERLSGMNGFKGRWKDLVWKRNDLAWKRNAEQFEWNELILQRNDSRRERNGSFGVVVRFWVCNVCCHFTLNKSLNSLFSLIFENVTLIDSVTFSEIM